MFNLLQEPENRQIKNRNCGYCGQPQNSDQGHFIMHLHLCEMRRIRQLEDEGKLKCQI